MKIIVQIRNYFLASVFFGLCFTLSDQILCSESTPHGNLPSAHDMQQLAAQLSPEEIDQAMKAVITICEELLKPTLSMLDSLSQIVTRLAQEINVKTIRVTDEKKMYSTLTAITRQINDLRNNAYTQIDPLQLILLIKFIQGVSDHLIKSIKTGFKTIEPFDLEQYVIDNPVPALGSNPFDIIQQELVHAHSKLALLIKASRTAGLSWFNTFFREVDNYIIEPTLKYKIHTRTGQVIATSAMFLFHLWLFLDTADSVNKGETQPPFIIKLEKLNLIKNLFGWNVPRYPQMDIPVKGFGPLVYHYAIRSLHHYLWVPHALSLAVFAWLWQDDFNQAKNWTSKKINSLRNRWKGGEYNKQADVIESILPTTTFDDIVGLDHIKARMEVVIDYMLYPERFDRTQALPERGYLFLGEPGTGKTEFAKALIGEIRKRLRELGRDENEINFLFPSITAIMEEGVEKLWAAAYHMKPCIVFIDEIDFLKLQRWSGDNKSLSSFLQLMNGVIDLGPKQQIIFIGATNKAQFLDFALKRPGRFGVQLTFNLPSLKHRKEFILKLLRKLAVELEPTDLDQLAQTTAGCTYEDIRHIIKGAIRKTQTIGIPFSAEELEKSFDENVRNIVALDDQVLSDRDQLLIATHQMGHALATLLLDKTMVIAKVTTRPIQHKMRDEGRWEVYDKKPEHEKQRSLTHGKVFTYHMHDSADIMSNSDIHTAGKILMAGYAAELVFLHDRHNYHTGCNGDTDDKNEAYQLALRLLLQGIDIRELSKQDQQDTRVRAYEMVKAWEAEVTALFEGNKELLTHLIQALYDKKSLSGKELHALISECDKVHTQPIEQTA